jgi:pyruvate dehydrogenase E2 component (dihydrolipoamide acetyltransferase)
VTDIVMPRLSDTMEEGTILRWLRQDGDEVARGEELVEIETDKATMVYESDANGTLAIVAAEGATLAVGELIARVGVVAQNGLDGPAGGPAGEGSRTAQDGGPARTEGEAIAAQGGQGDGPRADPQPDAVSASAAQARAADGTTAPDTPAAAAAPPLAPGPGARVKASPLARRIARERGVELAAVTGSGPGGRIVRADVESASAQGIAAPASEPAPRAAGTVAGAPPAPPAPGRDGDAVSTAKGQTTTVELTRTQQTIARRMAESKATIPDFALHMDVDMERCVKLRDELKALARPEDAPGEHAPTYNDMVVKACALALREHPLVNGSYRDGSAQLHSRVNVGVAVAADDALVVPTVFDADSKALGEIARETRVLAERVRDGSITPPELGGGTFTVSNLGMYGVSSFTAIINPPQAAILTVGALQRRAVPADGDGGDGGGAVAVRAMLTLTLVCDHRILYGAEAAQFLARVRELLQAPASLTL